MPGITLQNTSQLSFLLAHGATFNGKLQLDGKLYVVEGSGQAAIAYNYNDALPHWMNCAPRASLRWMEIADVAPFRHAISRQDQDAVQLTSVFRETAVLHAQGGRHQRSEAVADAGPARPDGAFDAIRAHGPSLVAMLQSRADFSGACLSHCDFTGLTIENADLSDAEFVQCTFSGTTIRNTSLRRATFTSCLFKGVTFERVDGRNHRKPAFSEGKVFEGVVLRHCKLEGNRFPDSDISAALLRDCELGRDGWPVEDALVVSAGEKLTLGGSESNRR